MLSRHKTLVCRQTGDRKKAYQEKRKEFLCPFFIGHHISRQLQKKPTTGNAAGKYMCRTVTGNASGCCLAIQPVKEQRPVLKHTAPDLKNKKGCQVFLNSPSKASGGIEPPHEGFADLSLTAWVRRHIMPRYYQKSGPVSSNQSLSYCQFSA